MVGRQSLPTVPKIFLFPALGRGVRGWDGTTFRPWERHVQKTHSTVTPEFVYGCGGYKASLLSGSYSMAVQ